MKILYIASNPSGQRTLLLEKEQTAMANNLARFDRAAAITLVTRPHIRIEELPDLISEEAPDVLHIAAHMTENKLILANEHDEKIEVDGERLVDLLFAIGHRFKLILLNACASAELATKLTVASDFVIGTTSDLSNRAARIGAVTLYGRLARANTVQQAFDGARSMLRVLQPGPIDYILACAPGKIPDSTRLAEPFRILAAISEFDDRINAKKGPPNLIDLAAMEHFRIEYGVAGSPPTAVQLIFFTDDPDLAEEAEDNELEDALSWIVRKTPSNGEIWIDDIRSAWGDIRWYAAVTTGDGKCFITRSSLAAALRRYYLDECWKGTLDEAWRQTIVSAIDQLRSAIGAKRRAEQ